MKWLIGWLMLTGFTMDFLWWLVLALAIAVILGTLARTYDRRRPRKRTRRLEP